MQNNDDGEDDDDDNDNDSIAALKSTKYLVV